MPAPIISTRDEYAIGVGRSPWGLSTNPVPSQWKHIRKFLGERIGAEDKTLNAFLFASFPSSPPPVSQTPRPRPWCLCSSSRRLHFRARFCFFVSVTSIPSPAHLSHHIIPYPAPPQPQSASALSILQLLDRKGKSLFLEQLPSRDKRKVEKGQPPPFRAMSPRKDTLFLAESDGGQCAHRAPHVAQRR
eukprot:28643-Pelagococcus_subviridis.AAC.2